MSSKNYPDADIAVIPLPSKIYSDVIPFGIDTRFYESKIVLHPTSAVTLIGYPYGYYDTINSLPIYKTGTIASEPNVDFNSKPLFLIDISAFPGMSGSPAFAIAYGAYLINDSTTTTGWAKKFLGIYASMEIIKEKKYVEEIGLNKKEGFILSESLMLGHIWKAQLILQIIKEIDVEKYEKEILSDL